MAWLGVGTNKELRNQQYPVSEEALALRLTTTVFKVEPVEHPKELSEQVEEELATLPPEEPE